MKRYINKDTLIAEIKKIYKKFNKQRNSEYLSTADLICIELKRLISFIDTYEIKEVDLEKHLKEDIGDVLFDLNGVAVKGATHYLTVEDVKDIAKYFFELGMVVNNSAQTDKEKIIAYIDKLLEKYPKNYYLLMVAEFIDNLNTKEE